MTKEERKRYNHEYYLRNKEKILADKKELYAHDENFRQSKIDNANIYAANNKERVKKIKLLYYANKKDEISEYNKKYYNENNIRNKRKKQRRKEKIITQENCV